MLFRLLHNSAIVIHAASHCSIGCFLNCSPAIFFLELNRVSDSQCLQAKTHTGICLKLRSSEEVFVCSAKGSHCNLCNSYDNQELELLLFCSSYRDGTLYVVVTHMIYLEFYCFHSVFLFNICNCNPSVHILANVNIVSLDLLRVKMFK